MDNSTIEIPKGFLKKLNDLNQDAKVLFNNYYLYPSGIVVSQPDEYKYSVGKHFCTTRYKFIDENDDKILRFNSQRIYSVIKDKKKFLTHIEMVDNTIFLTGEDIKEPIGEYFYPDSMQITKLNSEYEYILKSMEIVNTSKPDVHLDEYDVEAIVKNEYRNVSSGRYKSRITNKIIPGIKASHDITISFYNNDTDDRLFNMMIEAGRAMLHSFHLYTCIYI